MVYDPAKFKNGQVVKILELSVLRTFLQSWKLQPMHLEYAGRSAKVMKSYMYHGADVLYELEGIPGMWHEHFLELVEKPPT